MVQNNVARRELFKVLPVILWKIRKPQCLYILMFSPVSLILELKTFGIFTSARPLIGPLPIQEQIEN